MIYNHESGGTGSSENLSFPHTDGKRHHAFRTISPHQIRANRNPHVVSLPVDPSESLKSQAWLKRWVWLSPLPDPHTPVDAPKELEQTEFNLFYIM